MTRTTIMRAWKAQTNGPVRGVERKVGWETKKTYRGATLSSKDKEERR